MSKRICLCLDGTWNKPHQTHEGDLQPSNVFKVAKCIRPVSDDALQLVYYQTGVGSKGYKLRRLIDGASGLGLSENILDAYQFICHNYQPGDELYIFGFSRGAYTARSLAGLIGTIGVLSKEFLIFAHLGYQYYQKKNDIAPEKIQAFKEKNQVQDATIQFLGVWDTVGALGIPISAEFAMNRKLYALHDVTLGANVKHAYHALAIDEYRKAFAPTLWGKKAHDEQVMEQVWFAGAHSNVGGGYNDDGLANLALKWMVNRAEETGLAFDREILAHYKGSHHSKLRDSLGMYKLFGRLRRPVCESNCGNQSVHPSVKSLWDDNPGYRPKQLLSFAEKNGWVT